MHKYPLVNMFYQVYSKYLYYNYNENDNINIWNIPDKTYSQGGTCADWVILAMYFLHEINIESKFVSIYIPSLDDNHALLKIGNNYFESNGFKRTKCINKKIYLINYTLTYCEVISECE